MKPDQLFIQYIDDCTQLMVHPKRHWKKIMKSEYTFSGLFRKFFIPSLVFVFLSIILGNLIFESEYGFILMDALITASRRVMVLIMALFASSMIIYETSRWYRVPVEFDTALKISILSIFPLVIITFIVGIFPFLDIFGFVALYSLYLIYTALAEVYGITTKRNLNYVLVLLFAIFFSYAFISFLLSKLTALIVY